MNSIVFVSILSSLSASPVSTSAPAHCETFQRFLIQGSGTVVIYDNVDCMPGGPLGRKIKAGERNGVNP